MAARWQRYWRSTFKAGDTDNQRHARGIDRDAHMGCLEAGGNTYAVLGSGADTCYPKENPLSV